MPDVLGPCPPWCSGVHAAADQEPVDQGHQSASILLDTGTRFGQVSTLEAFLAWYPNSVLTSREVYAAVDFEGDFQHMSATDLEALATGLEVHAQRLRQLGQQLTKARR